MAGDFVGEVQVNVVPNGDAFNPKLQSIIDRASSVKVPDVTPGFDGSQVIDGSNQMAGAVEQAASRAEVSWGKVAGGVAVAAAAVYGLKAASDAVVGALSNVFDSLAKARAGFEAILGETKGNELLDEIREFARITPFATEGLVQYSQQLLGVGRAAESIVPTLGAVGDLVASRGGDSETINRVLFTLTQIQSVGRLIGQDALQLQSALIPITQLLAKQLGKTTTEVKALQAAGKITADQVFNALTVAGLEVEGAMIAATNSISGAKEGLSDTLQIMAQNSPVLQKFNEDIIQAIKTLTDFVGSDRVTEVIDSLGASFLVLYETIQPVSAQFTELSASIVLDLLEALVPIISALSKALDAIPQPVLTALIAFMSFNKFTTFLAGFGKLAELMQSFGTRTLGAVGAGLGQTTAAFDKARLSQTRMAVSTASASTSMALQGSSLSRLATQASATSAGMLAFSGAETSVAAASTAATSAINAQTSALNRRQRISKSLGGAGGIASATAGVAGIAALSQSSDQGTNTDGLLNVGGAAALGFSVAGPWGAAAGAAYGVWKTASDRARAQAEKDAEEWAEIGAEAATKYSEAYNANFSLEDNPIGRIEEGREFQEALRILQKAKEENAAISDEIQAAFETVGGEGSVPTVTRSTSTVLPEDAERARLTGQSPVFTRTTETTIDQNKIGEFNDAQLATGKLIAAEEAKILDLTLQIANSTNNKILPALSAEVALNEKSVFHYAQAKIEQQLQADTTLESVGHLKQFGISLTETSLTGEQLAFYFNEILADTAASSAAAIEWNNQLEEAQTLLKGINEAGDKEAASRIGAIEKELALRTTIAGLGVGSSDIDASKAVESVFANAATQAAASGLQGDALIKEQANIQAEGLLKIKDALEVTDDEWKRLLETTGRYDEFTNAMKTSSTSVVGTLSEIGRTAGITEEALKRMFGATGDATGIDFRLGEDVLSAIDLISRTGGVNGATSIAEAAAIMEAQDLIKENGIEIIDGIAQAADDAIRGIIGDAGSALSQMKQASELAESLGGLADQRIDNGFVDNITAAEYGVAALELAYQQASVAAAEGGDQVAIYNQIVAESFEEQRVAMGYTNEDFQDYLRTVGQYEAYANAAETATKGITGSLEEVASQLGITQDEMVVLFNLIEGFPTDLQLTVGLDATAALAGLKALKALMDSFKTGIGGLPSTEAYDVIQAGGGFDAQIAETERILASIGQGLNAQVSGSTSGAASRAAASSAAVAEEEDTSAQDAADAANEFNRLIENSAESLMSAVQTAADAIEAAAENWKSSIKESIQYERSVSASRATSNVNNQIEDIKFLSSGIEQLKAKGLSEAALSSLGIDGIEDVRQVQRLLSASAADLTALNSSVTTRDQLAEQLATNRQQDETGKTIVAAIVTAAKLLGWDVDEAKAKDIVANFTINGATDADYVANQILARMSAAKVSR